MNLLAGIKGQQSNSRDIITRQYIPLSLPKTFSCDIIYETFTVHHKTKYRVFLVINVAQHGSTN